MRSTIRKAILATTVAAALASGLVGCAGAPAAKNQEPSVEQAAAEPAVEQAAVTWADDAWAAFQAEVPKAVQKVAKKQIEKEARERGVSIIDMEFYNEIKKEQGR
jgi:hypothetical protein